MGVKAVHKKFKVHSLTGRITESLMAESFAAVRRNRGAPGVDRVSIGMYEANLEQNQARLMRDLKSREYSPKPLRRTYIPKEKNKLRPLGIPAIRDRVAQEVCRRLLDPVFEPGFHENSFGFRKGRNCHMAVEKVLEYIEQGYKEVVDADIKGFFDQISHDIIDDFVAAEVADGNILGLVNKFLRSGVLEDGWLKPTIKGVPQGGVISPLLANIVLNHLDWRLDAEGYKFVRYADDFVVLCKTRTGAEKALEFIRTVIETELELELSPEKTKVVSAKNGFNFLGFQITSRYVKMRDKSREKFKAKIRELTKRHHNLDSEVIEKLNRVIRGTVNYFGARFADVITTFRLLDAWVRKRIRCMKYKRISRKDNARMRTKHIHRLGLLSALDLCLAAKRS